MRGVVPCILILSAGYVVNQIYDVDIDRINVLMKETGPMSSLPIASGVMSIREAKIYAFSLYMLGLSLASMVSLEYLLCGLIGVITGIAYSVPPIRLKNRAGFDVIINAFSFGPLCFCAGWSTLKPIIKIPLFKIIWLFLFVAAIYIPTTIIDVDFDRKLNVKTIAVTLGPRRAAVLCFVLLLISLMVFTIFSWGSHFVYVHLFLLFMCTFLVKNPSPKRAFIFSACIYLSCFIYFIFNVIMALLF